MKNRLKGITLIETMLYVGLFSIIIVIVMNFMFSTQEATNRTNSRSLVHQASQFVIQHLNYSFDKSKGVNEENSTFGTNVGVLELIFTEGNKHYYILDSRLYFDGSPITPNNMTVTSFSLAPVRNEDAIIGIQTMIVLRSNRDAKIEDTINMLFIVR